MQAELGQAGDGTHSNSLPLSELSELVSYHKQKLVLVLPGCGFSKKPRQSLQLTEGAAPCAAVNAPGTALLTSAALFRYMFYSVRFGFWGLRLQQKSLKKEEHD